MAQEFEGLYVKFGANTTEFDNSVKGMNKALTLLKKDLQTLNKQLKLDPNNIDLLNKKMKNLQEQARVGALRVEELRKEQKALGDEKIGTAEWQKLESEIKKTEAQMQVVQRALDSTQSKLKSLTPGNIEYVNRQLDEMSEKLEKNAEKVGNVADKFDKAASAMAPFSAAATAGLVAGAKAAGDLQEQVSKTQAVFKSNSKEMDDYATNAIDNINMSENTARSIMNTYGAMGSGLGLTEKANKDMAKSLTTLTADVVAFNDVSEERAQTALKGIYTGETESLKELGVVMTQTNLENYAANKGYDKTIKNMSEAEKVALRYAYVQDALADAQGAAKREQDSFNGQLRLFKEQIIEIATNIGKVLMPTLEPLLKKLNEFTKKLKDMNADQLEKVVKVLLGLAAVAPVLFGVSKVLKTVQLAMNGLAGALKMLKGTKVAGMFAKMFGGISTGPLLIVVGAIVAVGVALKQLWDRSEHFRNAMKGIWDGISAQFVIFVRMFQNNTDALKDTWQAVWAYLEPAWTLFQELVGGAAVVIGAAIEGIVRVFKGLGTIITGALTGNLPLINAGLQEIEFAFRNFVKVVFDYFGTVNWAELATKAIQGIVNGLIAISQLLWTTFLWLMNTAIQFVTTINWVSVGSKILTWVINGIKSLGSFLWNTFITLMNTAINKINSINWNNVGYKVMNWIINGIKALAGTLWSVFTSTFTTAKSKSEGINWASVGTTIIRLIVSALGALYSALWGVLSGAFTSAMQNAKNINWSSVGSSIISGIVSGLTGLKDALVGRVQDAVASAKAAASGLWDKVTGGGKSSGGGSSRSFVTPAMQRMARTAMSMNVYNTPQVATSGTSLNISVDARGGNAQEIARQVEKIIVRRIQS